LGSGELKIRDLMASSPPARPRDKPDGRRDGKGAPPAVLLVEDNPADVTITRRALKEIGLPVELVVMRDGREALGYLLRQGEHASAPGWHFPDLVLLDLNLPGMSGRELLERIRATPVLRLVPVLVLTTSGRADDVAQMYAAGANTYIEKPQEFERFVQVLRAIHDYWFGSALLPPRE
jgi:CheY-like chemotaxis protein